MTARADPATPLIPEGLDATLVLLRHGESEWIREGRFQGQAETPLSATGRRQAALAAERLAAPHASPMLPGPARAAARDRPLAARPHDRDRGGVADAIGAGHRRWPPSRRPPGARDPRDRAGRLGGRDPRRDRPPLAGARRLAAAAVRSRGPRAASRSPQVQARARPALAACSSASAATTRAAPSTGRRSAATRAWARGRAAVVDPRRPRRRVQGRDADAVRPPAQPVLDVLVRPERDLRRRVPRRAGGPAGAQPDRAPRAAPRRARRRPRPRRARGRARSSRHRGAGARRAAATGRRNAGAAARPGGVGSRRGRPSRRAPPRRTRA